MFDTYRITPHIDVSHRHEVHEHRAPTDDSVKLLREMEQKARDEIVKSIRLEDSPIDAVLHLSHDCMNAQIRMAVIYSIGGKKRTVRHDYFQRGLAKHDEEMAAAIAIRDELAKDIANVLTETVMKASRKAFD